MRGSLSAALTPVPSAHLSAFLVDLRSKSQRTFSRGISLHKSLPRAGIGKLGRKEGKFRKKFIYDADFGRELVGVDVQSQKSADVAWVTAS